MADLLRKGSGELVTQVVQAELTEVLSVRYRGLTDNQGRPLVVMAIYLKVECLT